LEISLYSIIEKMENEPTKIRSEEVQEILGLVPNWMIQYGNTLILFLVIGALLISYFIKYPDTITSEVILTTANPIENIRAGINGEFFEIKVKNRSNVHNNESLATLYNNESRETLRSSINGQIHFVDFWEKRSNVQEGDLLFRIVPSNHGSIIGKIKIPANQAVKIEKGQRVKIHLSEQLNAKYSIIEGIVHNISTMADETGNIVVKARINEKLTTVNGKEVDFKPGITGTAEIIIEDLRLIERFFYQIKNIFKA